MNSQVTLIAFGQIFDAMLNQYVVNVLGILIGWLVPIAVTLVTIWVLLYGYATGVTSSRRLEARLAADVGFMVLAGQARPDHKTIDAHWV